MMKLDVDLKGLMKILNRALDETDLTQQEVIKEAGKRVVAAAIKMTPPGDASVSQSSDSTAARKKLERHIDRDLVGSPEVTNTRMRRSKSQGVPIIYAYPKQDYGGVLLPVDKSVKGVKMVDPVHFLKSSTVLKAGAKSVYRKLIGGKLTPRGVVTRATARRIAREKKKRIGSLASGWLPGANIVGYKSVPAWIKRHAGRASGSAGIMNRGGKLTLLIKNVAKYNEGQMRFVGKEAVRRTTKGMDHWLIGAKKSYLKRCRR